MVESQDNVKSGDPDVIFPQCLRDFFFGIIDIISVPCAEIDSEETRSRVQIVYSENN